ncbi:MAG: hypothetical protein U0353_32125 [Sandaracinus sp.]
MFRLLADEGINIEAITTSGIKVSCPRNGRQYHSSRCARCTTASAWARERLRARGGGSCGPLDEEAHVVADVEAGNSCRVRSGASFESSAAGVAGDVRARAARAHRADAAAVALVAVAEAVAVVVAVVAEGAVFSMQ